MVSILLSAKEKKKLTGKKKKYKVDKKIEIKYNVYINGRGKKWRKFELRRMEKLI